MRNLNIRVVASIAILVIGLTATIAALGSASPADSSYGILIDYGDYDIVYSPEDGDLQPLDALKDTCGSFGIELSLESGEVVSIGGYSSDEERSWRLYVVEQGSKEWSTASDPSSISSYVAVCYGYCEDGGTPSPAVDSTGYNFYSYGTPTRVVSLAPSCTESLCAVGGTDAIVGTDYYSNYPKEIVDRRSSGDIAGVGGFTNPSYEAILSLDPDLVVCIGSQSSHLHVAEKLRAVGIDVLVMDGGESTDSVLNNIYQAGVVLGNASASVDLIESLDEEIERIGEVVDGSGQDDKRVMMALSAVKSPWVAGSDTYASDVFYVAGASNIYSGESGWVQVNAETIAKLDPEVIIIVTSDYDATQEGYDSMLSSMSSEWKGTTAYRTGEIYLFTGDASDCASRPGPRIAQLAELVSRAVHGDAFSDGLPKFVGDNYLDYLTIAKEV